MIKVDEKEICITGDLHVCMIETITIVHTVARAIWNADNKENHEAVVHDMGIWVDAIIDAAWQQTIKQ